MAFDIDKLSKTEEGRIEIMKTLNNMSDQEDLKKDELVYWSYFHDLRDDDQFNYLRKVGENEFPAKIRRIPHHRSFMNLLISKQSKRESVFSIFTSDLKSREQKYNDRIKKTYSLWLTEVEKQAMLIQTQMDMMDDEFQRIQDELSKQPESEEEAMLIQEAMKELPIIKMEIDMAKIELSNGLALTEDRISEIKRYMKFDYKDIKDVVAEYMFIKLSDNYRLYKKSTRSFISKIVTGRSFVYVDYDPFIDQFFFEPINNLKVTYPSIESIEKVENAPWVKIDENWDYNAVVKRYGHMLTEPQIESLQVLSPSYESKTAFVPAEGMKAIDIDHIAKIGKRVTSNGAGIRVVRYFWKTTKKLRAIQSPNKKQTGKYFTHFIDSDKKIIFSTDYTYNSKEKKYIHKKNNDLQYNVKEVEVINPEKGERLETRYYDERYDGVCINDNIWLSWRSPIQWRSQDNFYDIFLPVFGRTFNGLTEYPYSLIGTTIPFVDTLELLYYHRELLLALTNIEGVVLDFSQKPRGMTDDEWYYQMKLGRYLIETVVNGKQVSSFNQFQRVGGAAHSIIQYIDNMINTTYSYMGETLGITQPAKGQVTRDDQVGTFEMSIDQSNLITQIIFEDHDESMAEAYTMLSNLYASYGIKKNDFLTLGGKDFSMIKIDKELLKDIDLECRVEDTIKQTRQLQEMKKIIKERSDANMIPLQHFITMYMTDSVRDLERTVQHFSEEATKAMEEQASNAMEREVQLKERMIATQGEMNAKLKQLEAEIKERQLQLTAALEEAKLSQKNMVDQSNMALKKEEIDNKKDKDNIDAQLRLLEIMNEAQVENSLIQENREGRLIDQKINALRLKMEALVNGISLGLQKMEGQNQHTQTMKKLAVEEKVAKKKMVEHVNDN